MLVLGDERVGCARRGEICLPGRAGIPPPTAPAWLPVSERSSRPANARPVLETQREQDRTSGITARSPSPSRPRNEHEASLRPGPSSAPAQAALRSRRRSGGRGGGPTSPGLNEFAFVDVGPELALEAVPVRFGVKAAGRPPSATVVPSPTGTVAVASTVAPRRRWEQAEVGRQGQRQEREPGHELGEQDQVAARQGTADRQQRDAKQSQSEGGGTLAPFSPERVAKPTHRKKGYKVSRSHL
jgi:hypothetical protein